MTDGRSGQIYLQLLKNNHYSQTTVTDSEMRQALDVVHSAQSVSMGAPRIPQVHWDDVGGLTDAKQAIIDTVQLVLLRPGCPDPVWLGNTSFVCRTVRARLATEWHTHAWPARLWQDLAGQG
jgi:hypothetical protein